MCCNKSDTYLCETCFNKIEIIPKYEKQAYLNRLISAVDYKNPVVQELIKKFKYNYIKELAQPLSQLLIKCRILYFPHNTLVIPIPLYKTRERTRGFNQAELLAKEIAKHFNLPLETNILKRTFPTIPQVDVKDHEKRKANIKGVFALNPEPNVVQGKTILLIDDVATTGATLSEAGKILKKSGANEVWALVVARG